MKLRELPPERVQLSRDDLRSRFVFKVHPRGAFGFAYAGITHGISHVSPGVSAWGEKRLERKALRVARRLMRRWRLTQAYVEFWYWPIDIVTDKPYRVVEVTI